MILTHDQMVAIIASGRSVWYGTRMILRVEDVPSDVQIATDQAAVAAAAQASDTSSATTTIAVDSVVVDPDTMPTVANVGTPRAPRFRFQLPRSQRNNFQLWLDAGYQGTLADFLAWLRGPPGATPTDDHLRSLILLVMPAVHDGQDGQDGEDGQDGVAATIAIRSITMLSAGSQPRAENVGSESAALLDFFLPLGQPGRDGEDGQDGTAATITIRSITMLPAGSLARVVNAGNATAALLDLYLPLGQPGRDGENGHDGLAATIVIDQVITGAAGSPATVENIGTDQRARLKITIPQGVPGAGVKGDAATIVISEVITGAAGSLAKVENLGNAQDVRLKITIPQGLPGSSIKGDAATITISEVITGAAGSAAKVENIGSAQDVRLKITIPQGLAGIGTKGDAATITIDQVITGAAGSVAKVENVGTAQDVKLKITIPQGIAGVGSKGDPGVIYQNGTNAPSVAKVWTGVATTDANSDATFTIPTGYFSAIHVVDPTVIRATTDITKAATCYVRAAPTTTSVVVRVVESKTSTVLVLNTAVEGLEPAGAGVTVHLVVWGV